MIPPFRMWYYYPIEMPLNEDGDGPVTRGPIHTMTYEVWDREFVSHGSFENLSDAIDRAAQLNNIKWEL